MHKYEKLLDPLNRFWESEPPIIIGIAGGCCSGRATLSRHISTDYFPGPQSCEIVTVIQQEWFLKEQSDVSTYSRYDPASYNIDDIVQLINKLKSQREGIRIAYRRPPYADIPLYIYIPWAPVIIINGLFAFYDPRLSSLINIKIFIDCDDDIRLTRYIKRDKKTIEEIIILWINIIKPSFDKWISTQRDDADIIINTNVKTPKAITMLRTFILAMVT